MNIVGKKIVSTALPELKQAATQIAPKIANFSAKASPSSMGQLGGLSRDLSAAPSRIPVASSRLRTSLPLPGAGGGKARDAFEAATSTASHLPGPLGTIGQLAHGFSGAGTSMATDLMGKFAQATGQTNVPSSGNADMKEAGDIGQMKDSADQSNKFQLAAQQIKASQDMTAALVDVLKNGVSNIKAAVSQ